MICEWASFFAGIVTGAGLLALVLLLLFRERDQIADYRDEHETMHHKE